MFLDDEVDLPPFPPTLGMSTSLEDQLYHDHVLNHDHVTGAFVDFYEGRTGLTPTKRALPQPAVSKT